MLILKKLSYGALFVTRPLQHRPVQSEGVLPLVFEKFPRVVSVSAGEEVPVVTLSASAPPVVGQDGLCDGGVSVEPGQELQGPPVTHISPGLAVRPQDLGLKQVRSGQVRSGLLCPRPTLYFITISVSSGNILAVTKSEVEKLFFSSLL